MELFQHAKTVRLRSKHDKFLVAEEDEEHVAQKRGSGGSTARRSRWTVEPVEGADNVIRLRSFYGRYLTASSEPFLLGATGKKVTQTLPAAGLEGAACVDWEPVREGVQVKLRTRNGKYLRANGGPPPWRNSVTHDVPQRTATQDWVLWDVEILEVLPRPGLATPSAPVVLEQPSPPTSPRSYFSSPPSVEDASTSTSSSGSPRLPILESSISFSGPVRKVDGRTIFYTVANDDEAVDESIRWPHLVFNGTSVPELTEILKEKTQLDDIVICVRSPLNKQQLLPITLQLPPSNAEMRLVVIDANSRGDRPSRNIFTFSSNDFAN